MVNTESSNVVNYGFYDRFTVDGINNGSCDPSPTGHVTVGAESYEVLRIPLLCRCSRSLLPGYLEKYHQQSPTNHTHGRHENEWCFS